MPGLNQRVGPMNLWVTLSRAPISSPDSNGFFEDLSPSGAWASIQPLAPGGGDGQTVQHLVTMRFHPQVSLTTRIVYDERELFVRGVQNINEAGAIMRLLCEEVQS